MRQSRTLSLYLAREIVLYAGLAFVAILSVLVSQNILRRLEDLVATGFTGRDFLTVLACLFPMLASYAVPIAFLFGALLAVRRQASDLELTAMQACGLPVRSMLVPAVALGLLVTAISGYLIIAVEHGARHQLIAVFKTVAARGGMLESGVFRGIGRSVIYVENHDRDHRLYGVMIADRESKKHPFVVFAEEGQLAFDTEAETIQLELERGDLHVEPSEDEPLGYQRISFDRFTYSMDVSDLVASAEAARRPKQMSLAELRDLLARVAAGENALRYLDEKNPIAYELEIHRRFAVPLAPLLFALIAVPLASLGGPGRRSLALLLGVLVAFGYYSLLTVGQLLALEGQIPAVVAQWLPNVVFAGLAVQLLRTADRGPTS